MARNAWDFGPDELETMMKELAEAQWVLAADMSRHNHAQTELMQRQGRLADATNKLSAVIAAYVRQPRTNRSGEALATPHR